MKTIFYNVDTQHDFMNKDGALYVSDAELIKPNLVKLTEFARKNNILIVGSVDRHFGTKEYKGREGELARWGGPFPDHCMDNTTGQLKIDETARPVFPSERIHSNLYSYSYFHPHYLDERVDEESLKKITSDVRQLEGVKSGFEEICVGLFFEKQSCDVFTNPAIERFLDIAEVKEAVVYGVATDYCVKAAVLGMQKRGIQTLVVEDAIKGIAPETIEKAIKEMKQAGAKFITIKQVLEEIVK